MKRRVLFPVLLVLFLVVIMVSGTANAAEETELEMLISQLPDVSDPLGTEFYFYNQLSDIEKVIYWKLSVATWEKPEITIRGIGDLSQEELDYSAGRAMVALMADDPAYHMYWLRTFQGKVTDEEYVVTLTRFPAVSEYHIQKANARVQHIAKTVGMEGDIYTRLRDLMDYLYEVMDYNQDLLARPEQLVFGYDDSAYGCLLSNMAVCGGFSDTVKLLCDELKIPCIVVHTTGPDAHAWNLIQLDNGKWYAVDAARDEYNWPIMGSESTSYNNDLGYISSPLCLLAMYGSFDDFVFPQLNADDYVHDTSYEPVYHDVTDEFTEIPSNFLYRINEDGTTCTIIGHEGSQAGDLIIPESMDGYAVTSIGPCAFLRCNGFDGELQIPATVIMIEEGAFYQCRNITGNLLLPDNLQIIQAYAFLGCKQLTGDLIIPGHVKEIGFCAFNSCEGFTGDLYIPNVESMGYNVFDNCTGLDGTLYLADNYMWTSSIVDNTNLTSVYVNPTNLQYAVYDGLLFDKSLKTLLWCPVGKEGSVDLPDGVEVIAASAFECCSKLTGDLILPEGLKVIEDHAFRQSGMNGVLYIPDTVETIGKYAFFATELVGDLVIPESVMSIGEGAFMDVPFDGRLILSSSLSGIEPFAFAYCKFKGDLVIPDGVKSIGDCAFLGCLFGGELKLPLSLECIGSMALAGSSSTYDTLRFSNVIDLSDSSIRLEKDAFAWTVFGGVICNCDAEFYEEIISYPESKMMRVCSVCGGTNWVPYGAELETPFPDVPDDTWYTDPVLWAVDNNITTGTGDGTTFSPGRACTRAQVVTFLWRAAGSPEPQSMNHNFTDVVAGSYYEKAVIWAVEQGITAGKGDATTFQPNLTCSRAEVVTFMWRAKGQPAPANENNPFPDVPAGSYYEQAVLWAVENGITTGKGDGRFAPTEDCTRAHVVTFLYRAFAEE